MVNSNSSVFGIISAVSWGAGDFCGGHATKKLDGKLVVFFSQIFGLITLTLLAVISQESIISQDDIIRSSIAGIAGSFGLVLLYRGLSTGKVSIIAPVSGLTSVIIPFIFSLIFEGIPKQIQLLGLGLAFISVWLISSNTNVDFSNINELKTGLLAGLGFGLFFVIIDGVQTGSVYIPLAIARLTSIILILFLTIKSSSYSKPQKKQLPIIALAGILDVGGNMFFVLATQSGRLDIAAVLSSLYPIITVILARVVNNEKIRKQRILGIIFAFFSVVCLTIQI